MKKILIYWILLFNVLIVKGQDFRNVSWGATQSQVKANENAEFYKEKADALFYLDDIAGHEALVTYIFAGNQLTRARYSVLTQHTNSNDYMMDYGKLKDLLTKKYGEPDSDDTIWQNDLYKDDKDNWGMAISIGHLSLYATWTTKETEIILALSGENHNIDLDIEYTSRKLKAKEDKLKQQKALAQFSKQGFRGVKWGASQETVKNKESAELIDETSNSVSYQTNIQGIPIYVGYLFTDNKLTMGRYLVYEKHSNKNDFITDYKDLKSILTKKLGEPKESEKYWKNDLYRDDYSQWGMAISIGHLMYYASWENQSSEISILLTGENYEIDLMIEYVSKEFNNLREEALEKETLEDF